ncbi:MAG: hypothetical protein JWO71_3098 [Candidatus Acidoferrum typicum]|nr:hypothetical protein [Candidatus Acidoferrum typicum]
MRFDEPALKDSRQIASIFGDFLSVAQCKRSDFPQRHNVLGVSSHFPVEPVLAVLERCRMLPPLAILCRTCCAQRFVSVSAVSPRLDAKRGKSYRLV